MKPRLLLDINIFIDVLENREGVDKSQLVINMCQEGFLEGWLLSNSIPVMQYMLSRTLGEFQARNAIQDILKGISVIPLRSGLMEQAFVSPSPDFEDNLQMEAAVQFNMDFIVTRNKRNFKESQVLAVTPEELLEIYRLKCTPLSRQKFDIFKVGNPALLIRRFLS